MAPSFFIFGLMTRIKSRIAMTARPPTTPPMMAPTGAPSLSSSPPDEGGGDTGDDAVVVTGGGDAGDDAVVGDDGDGDSGGDGGDDGGDDGGAPAETITTTGCEVLSAARSDAFSNELSSLGDNALASNRALASRVAFVTSTIRTVMISTRMSRPDATPVAPVVAVNEEEEASLS